MVRTWEDSVEIMDAMMHEVSRTSGTSVQAFEDMCIRRERLLARKANLIAKQKSLLAVMKALEIEKERLKNATQDQQANENFTEQKTISVVEIEKKTYYSTLCTHHRNVQVCHENCSLSYEPNLNFAHFKNCAAADGNNCRKCKCGMNQHSHSYEIPVSKEKTIEDIVQSKKAAFDQARKDVKTIGAQVNLFDYVRQNFQNEVNNIKDGLLTTIRELKQICTHFNFREEMNSTIQNLRKEAKIAQDLHAKQEYNNTADAIEQLLRQL